MTTPAFSWPIKTAVQQAHNAVIAALVAASYDFPTRRYITAGSSSYDCASFVTEWTLGDLGSAFGNQVVWEQHKGAFSRRNVHLNILITRCHDIKVQPLSAAHLTEIGLLVCDDAGALVGAAIQCRNDGTLSASCKDANIGPISTITSDGGLIGCALAIVIGV